MRESGPAVIQPYEHELARFYDVLERSAALADLAELSAANSGVGAERFPLKDALALHLKALDVRRPLRTAKLPALVYTRVLSCFRLRSCRSQQLPL